MEISTIPKVALDNHLASMGSSATFKEPPPLIKPNNGFTQLPAPLFHGASLGPPATAMSMKSPASTIPPLPGRGHMGDLATSSPHFFNECADPFAKEGSVPPQVKEKPKRARKSRAGAASNKRGTCVTILNINADGAQQPQIPPTKRRRLSAKLPGDGEPVEKPPPRKRNRSKAKAKEQLLSLSTSLGYSDPSSSKGMFGMDGLEIKTLHLSRYTKDISVESLMAGNFSMPPVPDKQGPKSNNIMDNSFGSHISSIIQNSTRPTNTDQARLGSLFSIPTENQLPEVSLNLESSPILASGRLLGTGLSDLSIKALGQESFSTPFLQCRKAQSLFNLETIPVPPPADFWNSLQVDSDVSLSSLTAQDSTITDNRFFPSGVGFNGEKFSSLPPSVFSLGSSRIPRESSDHRVASSKLNQWYSSEPANWDSLAKIQFQHSAPFPRGSMFPFNSDVATDASTMRSEKFEPKVGLFDIDLNKQSPEAEAAESIAHSTALVDAYNTDKELQSVQTLNASMPVMNKVKDMCTIKSLPDRQDTEHALEMCAVSQEKEEALERSSEESVSAIVNKPHSNKQVNDVPTNVSSSLLIWSILEVPETQEMCCTDVPCSPRMCSAARILCEMANSSNRFYVGRHEEHAQVITECDRNSCIHRPAKAAKISAPAKAARVSALVEKEARTHKHNALHESWNEECTVKAQMKEGLMFNHMDSSNGPNTEPWSSTPPRLATKNSASPMSGNPSSGSEKSPGYGLKEHKLHKELGNTKKSQRDQPCKVSSLFTRKDLNGNPKPLPKTSFLHTLPTTGLSISSQKRDRPLETKQSSSIYGDGLTKVSRPRSNLSKNCLQAQRSRNGCSLKSSTNSWHVLPYVGDVNGLK